MSYIINYEKGLAELSSSICSEDESIWKDFYLYKSQLLANIQEEEKFGSTETLRSERYRVIDKLNAIALSLTGNSFTDLCME